MAPEIHHIAQRLRNHIAATRDWMTSLSDAELEAPRAPGKWSKKEILGHLIDSAVNNLKRFSEIQFQPHPYQVVKYDQAALVKANDYQAAALPLLLDLWSSLNMQIARLMDAQNDTTLSYPIVTQDGDPADLRFLMQDYVVHLEHHLRQVGVPGL